MKLLKNREWIYENDKNNENRFSLGESGKRPLVVFGINPSTAEPNKLDNTLRKIKAISENLNYDGWIMFNIYPQRSTDPKGLHGNVEKDNHNLNLEIIKKLIVTYKISEFVAAWGNLIDLRKYLNETLIDIYNIASNYNISWKCFEVNKTGHPKHPLYLPLETTKIQSYDIKKQYRL